MKTKRCYLYTRVSTAIQVDGFSLEAQREKLRKYAEFQEMVIAGDISTEYDKLIDKQMERTAISCIAGFSKIFKEASAVLSLT